MLLTGEIHDKLIFLDEAAEYLPQGEHQSKEMERLIRHGRNFGDSFIFNTQRPSYLNKNTFNLSDMLFVFRTTGIRDLQVIREILENSGRKKAEIDAVIHKISNLKTGQFVFFDLTAGKNDENVK
jgi:DNA helicase HerA-like ATPase